MKSRFRVAAGRLHRCAVGMLPHIVIVLSLFFVTLFITDRFNRAMAFLNNDISRALLLVYALLCLWQGIEAFLGRYSRWGLPITLLAVLGSLVLLVGRLLDGTLRNRGYFNREPSKWVLFAVCCVMVAHGVLMILWERRRFQSGLAEEDEESR